MEHPDQFGIVGAGALGSTIARLLSGLGALTIVVAPRPGGVERAAEAIQRCYRSDVRHGRLTQAEADAGLRRVCVTPTYADLEGAAWVIESVTEDAATKQEVLAAVEAHVPPDCIIASTTSSIPIAAIASGAGRPENVIGMHYFWPAHRYRLVEIARAATGERTLQRTLDLIRWQGRVPLLVRDLPGFFTTRILLVYLNEAIALVTEGASVEAVDRAMQGFGWAMGPFRLLDAVGIEKFRGIYDTVAPHLGGRVDHVARLRPLLEAGHVGTRGVRREGATGFYRYPEGIEVDARVYPLLGRDAAVPPTQDELAIRPVWQMLNEIGHCLADGVVASADDADLGAVLGLGWPRARPAPLAYARQLGGRKIIEQLEAWTRRHGPRFAPSPALTDRLAADVPAEA